MTDFVQTTIDGLLVGSSYGMIALGFALIFGVFRRINLAYGACLLFGAALAVWTQSIFGFGAVGLILVTILGSTLASLYVELLCFSPHVGRHAISASMIASFAIWMQLDEVSALLLPQRTHAYDGLAFEMTELGPLLIRTEYIVVIGVAVLCLAGVSIWTSRSRLSLQVRAVKEDPDFAQTLGIPVRKVGLVVFGVAGAIGGLGTFLILSTDSQITPLFGIWSLFKGLAAVMIGGLGSLGGAVVGGLLLGLIEVYTVTTLGSEYRNIMTFGLLLAVLIFRPAGIFGAKEYRSEILAHERL